MLTKNRVIAAANTQKFESATDSFVLNAKNTIQIGTTIPPPPTPPAFDKAIIIPSTSAPKYSIISNGNTDLVDPESKFLLQNMFALIL